MAQATTKDWLDGIQKGLLQQLTENKGALPKGFNQDRFILNSITVIRDMLRDSKKKLIIRQFLSAWQRERSWGWISSMGNVTQSRMEEK